MENEKEPVQVAEEGVEVTQPIEEKKEKKMRSIMNYLDPSSKLGESEVVWGVMLMLLIAALFGLGFVSGKMYMQTDHFADLEPLDVDLWKCIKDSSVDERNSWQAKKGCAQNYVSSVEDLNSVELIRVGE